MIPDIIPNKPKYKMIYINQYIVDINKGLIAHWPLESGPADIINSMNGTLVGSPSFSLPEDKALNVSISKYMYVADYDRLSFTNGTTDLPFSISLKVKIDSLSGTKGLAAIIMKRSSADYTLMEWQLYYSWGTYGYSGFSFSLADSVNSASINVNTQEQITLGGEYHVVITYDGSKVNTGLKIIVNKIDKSNSRSNIGGTYSRTRNTSAQMYMAKNGWEDGAYFGGYIKNVKIYNYVIPESVINILFNEA